MQPQVTVTKPVSKVSRPGRMPQKHCCEPRHMHHLLRLREAGGRILVV